MYDISLYLYSSLIIDHNDLSVSDQQFVIINLTNVLCIHP